MKEKIVAIILSLTMIIGLGGTMQMCIRDRIQGAYI